MAEELIRMEGVNKFYGRVQALKNVNLTVNRSEIVGLLGDNGAGKSTLIKVLSGAVPSSSGSKINGGEKVRILRHDGRDRAGIETIYEDRRCREPSIANT